MIFVVYIIRRISGGYAKKFETDQYNPWNLGEHTVTVSYLGQTDEFKVKVVENPVERIEITKLPDKTEYIQYVDGYIRSRWDEETQQYEDYFYYDTHNYFSGFEMTVYYNNGTSAVYTFDENYWEFNGYPVNFETGQYDNPWNLGEHTVTVSYMGHTDEFKVKVVENPVERIEITKLPDKTEYIQYADGNWHTIWDDDLKQDVRYFNYEINRYLEGFEMKVHYKNGTSTVYTFDEDYFNGYPVNFESNQYNNPWNLGEHTVTVSYMGHTDEFKVKVVENPVERIEITKLPDKTEYIQYVDGYISSRWDEETQQYEDYFYYDTHNYFSGFEMMVYYSDGTSSVYSFDENYGEFNGYPVNFETDQYDNPWNLGEHTVTVSYLGQTDEFKVKVVESPVSSIKIIKDPKDTHYIEGELPNADGMVLKVYYKDGSSKDIELNFNSYLNEFWIEEDWGGAYKCTVNFEKDGEILYDGAKPGINQLVVEYLGVRTSKNITVYENSIVSYELIKPPTNVYGTDMVIKAIYKDGKTSELQIKAVCSRWGAEDDGYLLSGGEALTDDGFFRFEAKVKYKGFYQIEDFAYTLNNIDVKISSSNKREIFAQIGVSMLVSDTAGKIYLLANILNKKPDVHFNGELTRENIDIIATGSHFMHYHWFSEYFGSVISGSKLSEIMHSLFVITKDDFTLSKYYDPQNNTYDFPVEGFGGTFTQKISLRKSGNNYMAQVFMADFDEEGEPYNEITYYITVTPENKIQLFTSQLMLESISVTKLPSKTTYNVGENLNTSGIVVTAHYIDGSSSTVSSGLKYVYDFSKEGTRTVKVEYQGKTASFTVTVQTPKPGTITSDVYSVNGDYLSKITSGTTVSQLLNGLNEKAYLKVFKGSTEVSGATKLCTGMTVCLMDGSTVKKRLTIIVTGDVNGDGDITVTDMIAIKADILNKSKLSGVYSKAADTNGDSTISITDFIQIKAHILGKDSIKGRAHS